MVFLGNVQGSFFAGERISKVPAPPILYCSIGVVGAASITKLSDVVTSKDYTVTGTLGGGNIWGSNPYTNDSDIARAAVHSGSVAVGETATVTLYNPGEYHTTPGYIASTRNGITTLSWNSAWCGFYMRRTSVGNLSGIASATDLVSYFRSAPGTAYRFTTLPGINQVSVDNINYAPYSTAGMGMTPIVTKDYTIQNAQLGTNNIGFSGGVDDGYFTFVLPQGWNTNFLGTQYPAFYVGTNGYVTFGSGSSLYSGLSYASPPYPKIMISAGDNSTQRIWYGLYGSAPNRFLVVQQEGLNTLHYYDPTNTLPIDSPNYPNGPWQTGVGPMAWQMVFYEGSPNVINFFILANSRWA